MPESVVQKPKKKRYDILDLLRGFSLINMIAFHTMYDIVFIFGHSCPWYVGKAGYIWQQYICWSFIFISGYCWQFSKKKLRRGLIVFGAGALVTLGTLLFMPEEIVIFGVLTMIGSSMLLMIPIHYLIERFSKKISDSKQLLFTIGLLISIVCFVITKNITIKELGFEGITFLKLPEGLYHCGYGMTFLGFCDTTFKSSDYFSMMPWFFLFASGYFLNRLSEKKQENLMKFNTDSKLVMPLKVMGRYSLWIYLAHQPVIYGILWVIHSI